MSFLHYVALMRNVNLLHIDVDKRVINLWLLEFSIKNYVQQFLISLFFLLTSNSFFINLHNMFKFDIQWYKYT